MQTFYLGTHVTTWLRKVSVPLFVSRRTMPKRKPRESITCGWALDSGGFSELSLYGKWTVSPKQYADEVRIWSGWGGLHFAACQDWMCEPHIVKKTGLSVKEHQSRTVENYLQLVEMVPEIPWIPVVQGFTPDEYFDHVKQYRACGVPIADGQLVGVGSVCRRQSVKGKDGLESLVCVFRDLSKEGARLHGFGIKLAGLPSLSKFLYSSDSLAWSFAARRDPNGALPECVAEGATHKNCANCLRYALRWREKVMRFVDV